MLKSGLFPEASLRSDSRLKDYDGRGLSFPRAIVRLASDRKSLAEVGMGVESGQDFRVDHGATAAGGGDEETREERGTMTEKYGEDSPMDAWLSSEGSHALF